MSDKVFLIASGQIIWPTKKHLYDGLAQVERYSRQWQREPALLVIEPPHGLIVALKEISHDDRFLKLYIAVERHTTAVADA